MHFRILPSSFSAVIVFFPSKSNLLPAFGLQEDGSKCVLDYADVIYMHSAMHPLQLLDALYHSSLKLLTGDSFRAHHCISYKKVLWPFLTTLR